MKRIQKYTKYSYEMRARIVSDRPTKVQLNFFMVAMTITNFIVSKTD